MLKEPMFLEPCTFRDYHRFELEQARVRGWNEAMEFIFAQELERKRVEQTRASFSILDGSEVE